jgi:hypothetical protein
MMASAEEIMEFDAAIQACKDMIPDNLDIVTSYTLHDMIDAVNHAASHMFTDNSEHNHVADMKLARDLHKFVCRTLEKGCYMPRQIMFAYHVCNHVRHVVERFYHMYYRDIHPIIISANNPEWNQLRLDVLINRIRHDILQRNRNYAIIETYINYIIRLISAFGYFCRVIELGLSGDYIREIMQTIDIHNGDAFYYWYTI